MKAPLPLVVALALVASACVQSPASTTDPGPTEPSAFVPTMVDAITGCASGCWEPATAVDAQGRIFIVAASEPRMGVSLDGGHSFEQTRSPPVPSGAPPGVTQVDGYVQVGPNGKLHYIAFLMGPWPASIGLQIAISSDAAKTWESNKFLALTTDPQQSVAPPWKSWLGFGPDGQTVYFLYNQRPSGVWLGRSDDGGKTFGPFKTIHMPGERIISAFPAQPVVDSKGRFYAVYFGDQTPQDPTGNPFVFKGHTLRLAYSDDKGATFRYAVVQTKAPPNWVGSFFPSVAVDETDRLFVTYWNDKAEIMVTSSLDRGLTWSPPVKWSQDRKSVVGGWIEAQNQTVSVIYYEGTGESVALSYARASILDGPIGAPTERGVLHDKTSNSGDFAHSDLMPDGRIVAATPSSDRTSTVAVFGPK